MNDQVVLPARQVQVLRLVAEGLSNQQAADRMGVAEGSIRGHLYRASKTLGARHRVHAVVLATAAGVLP